MKMKKYKNFKFQKYTENIINFIFDDIQPEFINL